MKKFLIFITLLFGLYAGGWFFLAYKIQEKTDKFYMEDGPALGYVFFGDAPRISGFPFKPVISYQKGFEKSGIRVAFKEINLKFIPLAGLPLDIHLDNLVVTPGNNSNENYEIDSIDTILTIPSYLPEKATFNQISAWQKDVGNIEIKLLEMTKNNMRAKAFGVIGLDDKLQPQITFDTEIINYPELVNFITDNDKNIRLKNLLLTILNSLSKTNPDTGERFVQIPLKLEKRRVAVGPIKTIKVPAIEWPKDY